MKLGEKIYSLRKEHKLSQEDLAERINVTRQTISNWELGSTSPNPEQLKMLSKELSISIDKLLDNDLENILEKKISNTEQLAGIIIKILKVMGILLIVYFILIVIAGILFSINKSSKVENNFSSIELTCTLSDKTYEYYIEELDNKIVDYNGSEFINNLLQDKKFENSRAMVKFIESYFKDNGGHC